MASNMLLVMCFVTAIVLGDILGSDSTNFPLDNCTTDEMDILELYLIDSIYLSFYSQHLWGNVFSNRDPELPDEKTISRVRYAKIIDGFDYQNNDVNVSSWSFQSIGEDPNLHVIEVKPSMYLLSKTAKETMHIKMTFVQRLFSEMRGVRENATHIAVIFVEDSYFSDDEIKNIPHIVQQQITKLKTFFAILSDRPKQDIVHLKDSIVLPSSSYTLERLSQHYLYMAMCKLCSPGWFPYEHNDSVDLLSCYMLITGDAFSCYFKSIGFAALVETLDELTFLQTRLYWELKNVENRFYRTGDSSQVYIGLQRDRYSNARRFKWFDRPYNVSVSHFPMVVNHWMPGKPDGGFDNDCAVWQFADIWKDDNNDSNMFQAFSRYKNSFDEGWVDGSCYHETLSLCEIALPQRLKEEDIIGIKSANTKSFSKVLTNFDVMKFGENIVSISTHVASTSFLQFLKAIKSDVPVFDCGEDAGHPRYISYTFVCDYVDHCTSKRDEISCSKSIATTLRSCDSGEYISYNFDRCDGINDCQDGSDENDCNNQCTGKYCRDGSCLKLQWLNDGEIDCFISQHVFNGDYGLQLQQWQNDVDTDFPISQDGSDEDFVKNKYFGENETCSFICNKEETCVHLSQLNDGFKDCTGAEGPLDETIGKLEPANTCYNLLGNVIWAPKCVYVRDRYGAVLGCRDMSHLQDCLNYECVEGYVKCYKSYCIPQHYVLDGQADCPTGEEENYLNTGSCSGNFACWDSKVCLHPDLVCNGYPDCPHKDDELNCVVSCPDGFRCVSGAVTISGYNTFVSFKNLSVFDERTRYLDLSGLDLSKLFTLNTATRNYFLQYLFVIKLSKCNMHSFGSQSFSFVQFTHTLDISYNLLQNFTGMDYTLKYIHHLNLSHNTHLVLVNNLHFPLLEELDLSHTALSYLHESMFRRLPNLRHLFLSYTFITDIHGNSFPSHFTLQTLDLREIPIENFYEDLFGGLIINDDLYTDKYEVCCPQIRGTQIPYHTCHAPEDAISSCFDLVRVHVQRVFLWVVAVLAVLGNITVIGYRLIWDRSVLKTGYGLFVTNLGISDLIMGVYLFIIAGADYYYRDIYVLHHKIWRESVVCKVAAFLATLSSETSKLFILLITLDRFLVMKFPFGQIKFSKVSTRIAILLSWCTGFIVSLIPIVFMFKVNSSNAMCLGLPLTNQRLKGWEYSFGVFIGLNFLMCLIIACGQIAIFRAMSDNRFTRLISNTPAIWRMEDIIVAKRLSLVVMSDFLCWFPVGVMGLLSLVGLEISNDVYAWTAVLVLPINSAVNPFLYTTSAIIARWEKFKNGQRKVS